MRLQNQKKEKYVYKNPWSDVISVFFWGLSPELGGQADYVDL